MQDQGLKDKAKKMKEYVQRMITNERTEILTVLELIDDIQRLGLGYKYQDEIRGVVSRCVSWMMNNEGTTKSLHATALSFRLLRQHGYEVSQGTHHTFFFFSPPTTRGANALFFVSNF